MLFSSITFIYLFLPIVCAIYFLVRKNLHNYVLLIASLFFYAWGEPKYLLVMLLSILTVYLGAICVDSCKKNILRVIILSFTILADLSFLLFFKYFNFTLENLKYLVSLQIKPLEIVMPIGISFYTFQALSYLIDVYRGDAKVQKDFYKLALYISLFPQLVAGPIVKYHDIAGQIESRKESAQKVIYGVKRFIIGLSKKVLIANTLGMIADKIFIQPVENFDALTAWIGAIAYSFQIFYDFSGYSDMAIGLASIFGFKLLENFNYPYISRSVSEFWRRWHISLSTWFKEYLYIPLGGNRTGKIRNCFNLFIVFLVTGFWHGAAWNFIFWGLWHGMFIIFEKMTGWHKKEGRLIATIQHIYCIFIFVIGWVIFRAENLPYALQYLKNMFGLIKEHTITYELPYYVDNAEIVAFVVAFVCSIPIFAKISEPKNNRAVYQCVINLWLMFLFIVSTAFIAVSTYNPFIYFRF